MRSLSAKLAVQAFCALAALQVAAPLLAGADAELPKIFGGARVEEVYRLRLDRGDLVLESINAAIKEHNIQDGAVLTGLGSVQDCTYHGVVSLGVPARDQFETAKGPTEVLSLGGIIAAGEPHLHITLSNFKKGAFGGHLDNGCRVLYRLELTVAKFSGVPLERKPNQEKIPVLQQK